MCFHLWLFLVTWMMSFLTDCTSGGIHYSTFCILKPPYFTFVFWNSCFFFPFHALKTFLSYLLTCIVSDEMSAVNPIFALRLKNAFSSLSLLLRLSSSLVLSNLKTICMAFYSFFLLMHLEIGLIELLGSESSWFILNLEKFPWLFLLTFFLSSPPPLLGSTCTYRWPEVVLVPHCALLETHCSFPVSPGTAFLADSPSSLFSSSAVFNPPLTPPWVFLPSDLIVSSLEFWFEWTLKKPLNCGKIHKT